VRNLRREIFDRFTSAVQIGLRHSTGLPSNPLAQSLSQT
jgi:hypothetical protein